jgi:endonuclease-3
MTIQIPALEWVCNAEGYLRDVDGIKQQISPYTIHGPLISSLDMDGVQPSEMQWTPLLKLRSCDPYIRKLRDFFPGLYFMSGQDPFKCLVLTVLTQNKTAERARMAFYRLVRRFGTIDPETLSVANPHDIVPVLYRCGPHRKAGYLVSLAREIMRRWKGDMAWVYGAAEHAREVLVSLPGVGPKTADCVLLYAAGHEVVPIDTHVERVARRLGFIERGALQQGFTIDLQKMRGSDRSKDIAKEALEKELIFPGRSHVLLIQLGFEFCHAVAPDCLACPIRGECSSLDNAAKRLDPSLMEL